jgi:hypothetical protein
VKKKKLTPSLDGRIEALRVDAVVEGEAQAMDLFAQVRERPVREVRRCCHRGPSLARLAGAM